MNNAAKYGRGRDVIAKSLDSGPDFCYFSAIKYATRMRKVSEMSFFKKWYYRIVLHKGGRKKDYFKMIDFIERMKGRYASTAYKCMDECEKILEYGV